MLIKELEMIFQTSIVCNRNGNMEELERKIYDQILIFRLRLLCYRCQHWKSEFLCICTTGWKKIEHYRVT